MDMTGEYRIPAPRERVWAMLNDPEVLRECLPGCEMLEGSPEDGFTARVTTKIGPVKATFNGAVKLSDVRPPESYTISGEGKGGVAGFAKGGADVHLAAEGDETLLTYKATAQVGGKLAQLGSRLIDSTAKKLADQFFSSFAARSSVTPAASSLDGMDPAAGTTSAAVIADAPASMSPAPAAGIVTASHATVGATPARSSASSATALWIAIAAAVAVVLIYLIAT